MINPKLTISPKKLLNFCAQFLTQEMASFTNSGNTKREQISTSQSQLKGEANSVNQSKQPPVKAKRNVGLGLRLFLLGVAFILFVVFYSTPFFVEKSKTLANEKLPIDPLDTNFLSIHAKLQRGTTFVKDLSLKVRAWELERNVFDIYVFMGCRNFHNCTEVREYESVSLHTEKNVSDTTFKIPIDTEDSFSYCFVVVNSDPKVTKNVNIVATLEWNESRLGINAIPWLFIFAVFGFLLIITGLSLIIYPPLGNKILRKILRLP